MNILKTDLLKKTLFLLLAGVVALNFTACSDEDDNNGNNPDDPDAVVFDQKEFLQNSLVRVDEAGNFMYRVLGAPLDADTTVLYVGADDLAEAKTLFKGLFAPGSAFSENGDNISCTLEKNGGTVTFVPASGDNGELADVTFSGCNLVAVSSLHFVEKSAWPDNDANSPYKIGERVRRQTLMDGEQDWICVREAEPGQPGILYYMGTTSLSADSYRPYVSRNKYSQSELVLMRSLLGTADYWCDDYYCTANRYYPITSGQAKKASCPILEFCFFETNNHTQIGDYYMKDGSLIGKNARLTDAQKRDCIGIVCWVGDPTGYDEELKRDHPGCTHGLVLALNDAIGGGDAFNPKKKMMWCTNDDRWLGGVSMNAGYSNTKNLRSYNSKNPSQLVYPVDAIDNYGDDFEQEAPSCSSGWYFPAVQELIKVCDVKDVLWHQLDQVSEDREIWYSFYWSSTEYDNDRVFCVDFGSGKVFTNIGTKNYEGFRVRPFLAF